MDTNKHLRRFNAISSEMSLSQQEVKLFQLAKHVQRNAGILQQSAKL